MPEEVNPYASPAEINEVAEDPADVALRRLAGPSLGLLFLAGMTAPWVVVIPFLPIVYFVRVYAMHDTPRTDEVLSALAISVASVSNCAIVVRAWNMRHGKRCKLAYATAALSCVPLLSAGGYLGIPFGIWALIALHRKDIKAAFGAIAAKKIGVTG